MSQEFTRGEVSARLVLGGNVAVRVGAYRLQMDQQEMNDLIEVLSEVRDLLRKGREIEQRMKDSA